MFWKRTSLLPDNSCHWPKGEKARERRVRRRGREGQGRRDRGEEGGGRKGEKDGEGGIQNKNDISLSASKCNHRLTSLKWVSGASLSLQSNLPSPTPTDVFDVKLIIK